MCKIKSYQVWGDMTADKSSDAYPVMDLCADCASSYEIVTEESSMGNLCEGCGCEDNTIELENRQNEINEEIIVLEEKIEETDNESEIEKFQNSLEELKQELEKIEEELRD